MNFDLISLCENLNAEHEVLTHPDCEETSLIFRFRDSLLRYELQVHGWNDSVMLTADPEEPIQACPLLEYGFVCTEIEIGENAYHPKAGHAIRFWEHRQNHHGLRLTLTPRGDNRWYIWSNAWENK